MKKIEKLFGKKVYYEKQLEEEIYYIIFSGNCRY